MKIELRNYADGANWHFFFELFSSAEYRPIWQILGVSEAIVSRPESLIHIGSGYLGSLTRERVKNTSYETTLEDINESIRLNQLANLMSAFASILEQYGLEVATELYSLADRAFLDGKGSFWSIWLELFSGDIEIDFPLSKYLGKTENKQLIQIVSSQLSILNEHKMKIAKELPDIFREDKFAIIENGLERECASRIWQEIEISFENEIKEKIYQWGYDNVDYITTEKVWSDMKPECFSVSGNQTVP